MGLESHFEAGIHEKQEVGKKKCWVQTFIKLVDWFCASNMIFEYVFVRRTMHLAGSKH